MSKVHVWYMTEEERLAYIEKYPINPDYAEIEKRKSKASYVDIHEMKRKKVK